MAVTSTSNANMSNKYSGDLLHAGPRVTATPLLRLAGVAHAAMMLSLLYLFGLPGGFLAQAQAALSVAVQQRRRPLQAGLAIAAVLLSPGAWRDAIVSHGLPVLLRMSDDNFAPIKRLAIFPHARGKVLELGAGTGMTCKYYDADKITELFLVEPMKELHDTLRENIAAVPGLAGKTRVVPCGIEARGELAKQGVTPGSLDTITLVQVLCSIPDPASHLAFLQSLLKPGGQLLLFEHVVSEDPLTARLQRAYNPIWTTLSGGCNVNRASAQAVKDLGGWASVTLQRPRGSHGGAFYPNVVARYVKA